MADLVALLRISDEALPNAAADRIVELEAALADLQKAAFAAIDASGTHWVAPWEAPAATPDISDEAWAAARDFYRAERA